MYKRNDYNMENLNIIAAIGKNYELGKDNNLIWRTKEDMSFFKSKTLNHHIVMGRKTFESLSGVLPNRTSIVLTTSNMIVPENVIKYKDLETLLRFVENLNDQVFVIGGAQIYTELINYANQLFLTEFDAIYDGQAEAEAEAEADAYFPQFEKCKFEEVLLGEYEEEIVKTHDKIHYLRKAYIRNR